MSGSSKDARRGRGELESQVLRVLWDAQVPLSAKAIQAAIAGRRPAHTTVLTALERLGDKGDVARTEAEGRGNLFAATRTEAEHTSLAMINRLSSTSNREAALLRFAGNLDADDIAFLRRAIAPEGEASEGDGS